MMLSGNWTRSVACEEKRMVYDRGRSTSGLEKRIDGLDWRYATLLARFKRPKIGAGIPVKPPLAPKKPLDDWDIESDPEGDFEPTRKCKSLLKKRWGCLPDECHDSVKTLQLVEYILHSLQREDPAINRIGGIRDKEVSREGFP
ncbi:hypothetical protein SELMODRAFT_420023 [Selaginella moellendorffii]|uniref:Uncharacterized protein n=1 Tax=Selaginella moellendorffii TaxID=88036 RepID=D8SAB0_SELML|nr:hypothetical protein SELMODRAFT_420023 [Selaginella moellendorffii]